MTKSPELIEVLPDPISLIESMRAVGYSVEAAVADIVDNSISAGASLISVDYDASRSPYVAVLDDGEGMTGDELKEAMRHGRNPNDQRSLTDLGRFGLGLKTASLSQGRRLTVVSRKNGETSARAWDLDTVAEQNRWVIEVPSEMTVQSLPLFDRLVTLQSGTLVIWEKLDRLISGAKDQSAELTLKFQELESHLSLVFHRFLAGEVGYPAIKILLNGRPLPRCDPFLTDVSFTQRLEHQNFPSPLGTVVVTPYVLPPIEKLTSEQIALAGGRGGLRSSQGFYIYRSRRLVIWGTWFRLTSKDEFYKLCRVKVDVPNTFDELWNLDIKKSAANPPSMIRDHLKNLVPRFLGKSRTTLTYRGRVQRTASFCPVWQVVEQSNGNATYQINSDHPLLQQITTDLSKAQLSRLEAFLDLVGVSLPLDVIYAARCADELNSVESSFDTYLSMFRKIVDVTGLEPREVLTINPFDAVPELHERFLAKVN